LILVEVTVLRNPDARTLRERIAAIGQIARSPAVVVLALSVAILATAAALAGDHDGIRHAVRTTARDSGPAGVAAAYGYPPRCLSITIVASGETYARADFNHASACGRFAGDPTAIFLRVMGAWRPVLKAIGYVCPVAALPVHVQTELGVCWLPSSGSPRSIRAAAWPPGCDRRAEICLPADR
jgi:hypothetical protein